MIVFQQKMARARKSQTEFWVRQEKLSQLVIHIIGIRFNSIHSSVIGKSVYMYCALCIDIPILATISPTFVAKSLSHLKITIQIAKTFDRNSTNKLKIGYASALLHFSVTQTNGWNNNGRMFCIESIAN